MRADAMRYGRVPGSGWLWLHAGRVVRTGTLVAVVWMVALPAVAALRDDATRLPGTGGATDERTAPAETVMIGDSTYDMVMARGAQVTALGVAWGYHTPEALRAAGAHAVMDNFSELEAALFARIAAA